jgi:hypothetical protein
MEMLVESMRYVVICGLPRIRGKKCLGGIWVVVKGAGQVLNFCEEK